MTAKPPALQLNSGIIQVFYDGQFKVARHVKGKKERAEVMAFHTRQMVNLHKEKYFIWKPDFKP